MTDKMQLDDQRVPQASPYRPIFYEISPDLAFRPAAAPGFCFELALHAEMAEPLPPGHPKLGELLSVLIGVADLLIQRTQTHAPYELDLSASHYTLHPPPTGGTARPGLSRTIRLVFSGVTPAAAHGEPPLLTRIRKELRLCHIPGRAGTGCEVSR